MRSPCARVSTISSPITICASSSESTRPWQTAMCRRLHDRSLSASGGGLVGPILRFRERRRSHNQRSNPADAVGPSQVAAAGGERRASATAR